jgi:hypothetical protein
VIGEGTNARAVVHREVGRHHRLEIHKHFAFLLFFLAES